MCLSGMLLFLFFGIYSYLIKCIYTICGKSASNKRDCLWNQCARSIDLKSVISTLSLCTYVGIVTLNSQVPGNQTQTKNDALDTVQLSSLYDLAEETQETDSLASFRHAFEGLELARRNGNSKWQSRMHQLVGQLMYTANQPDSSLHHYEQALDIAERAEEKREIAKSNFLLAQCHAYYFSSFAIAFNYSIDALHTWEELEDEHEVVASYHQLSNLLYSQEKPQESLEYAMKSKELAEEIGDISGLCGAYYSIGYAYIQLEDAASAIPYFEKLLAERRNQGDDNQIATALNARGNAYKNNQEYAKATIDYEEGLALARKIKYQRYIPVFINNIGHNFMLQEDYASALPYVKEGMGIMEKAGQNVNAVEGYQNLYKIYAGLGQFENAYEYQLKYNAARDHAFTLEKESITADLQTKYETEKKESTISLQSQQIKQQKSRQWFFIAFAGLLGVFLIVLYRNYATKQKLNRQLESSNEELEAKNNQNELLLKEIHHRIKNNLEVVSSLLALQSRQLEDKGAKSAMHESQNRVQSMGIIHQKLYQGKNLAAIEMKDYFINLGEGILDSYGKTEQIHIDYAMDEMELDVDTAVPIGLIVNELLTNSLKYAFTDQSNPNIQIQLERMQDKSLQLKVSDNGIGKTESDIVKGTGFGSQLIQLLTDQLEGAMNYVSDQGSHFTFLFRPVGS